MTKRRAFSYIRMSTEAQLQGHSLERQLELARVYAKENNLELVEDLCDIGLSAHDGANIERGKLGIFLKGIASGEVDKNSILLVESLDRLSRKSPRRAFNQFNEILDYGIEIHTIFDRQIYTSDSVDKNPGQLFTSIGYMLRAFSESEEKSRRLKKRWQSNRDNVDSKILTTLCPAWLKPNSTKTGFEGIPERTKCIRKIFDLCIDESMGAYSIACFLNEFSGVYSRFTAPKKKNRGSNNEHRTGWQKSYILKILNNPSVYGKFQPHEMVNGIRRPVGESLNNYFPEIISKERFILAQSKLKSRRVSGGGRKGEAFNNIFTKFVFCENCGGAVHFIDKGESPKGGKYLRCSNSVSNHKCNFGSWNYEEFEDAFLSFVTDIEFGVALQKGSDKSKKSKLLEEQQIVAEKIAKNTSTIETLLDIEGGMSDLAITKIRKKIEELSSELQILDARRDKINFELADIQARSSQKIHDDVIASIKKVQTSATKEETVSIRRIIHNQISLVVDKIILGGLAQKDDIGTRNFTVIFKNGEEQTVFPYSMEESDEWEIREINADGLCIMDGPINKISSNSIKFLGHIDMAELEKGNIKIINPSGKQKL